MRERIFKLFAKHGLLSRISNSTLQQEENEKKMNRKNSQATVVVQAYNLEGHFILPDHIQLLREVRVGIQCRILKVEVFSIPCKIISDQGNQSWQWSKAGTIDILLPGCITHNLVNYFYTVWKYMLRDGATCRRLDHPPKFLLLFFCHDKTLWLVLLIKKVFNLVFTIAEGKYMTIIFRTWQQSGTLAGMILEK